LNSSFYDGPVTQPTVQQCLSEAQLCYWLVGIVNRWNAVGWNVATLRAFDATAHGDRLRATLSTNSKKLKFVTNG
jgi:hypothetical protein